MGEQMNMEKYGVGIIGTGWVAGEHARAYQGNPHTQLRAVCGRTRAKAKVFAQAMQADCEVYDDCAAMLARDDIDIVSIATPPDCHCEQAVAAARAGKHLLLEKAMATTLDDARAIRDAVAASGVKSVVSFVLRWNPLFNIIKTQLKDDAVGKVFLGEVDYYHGIGPWYKQYGWNIKKDVGVSALLSAGCHAVDALRWFMGGRIVEVMQYATFNRGVDFSDYEYAPTSCTLCKFEDGRVGKVTAAIACVQPYVFNITLVGAHGTIRNNQIFSKLKYPGQTGWTTVPTILPDSSDIPQHPFIGEAAHLVNCIQFDEESFVSVADAYITHEVCFAADMSGTTGQPVALPLP